MRAIDKEYIERESFIKILKETKDDCKHYPNKVVCDFAIRMVNLMPPADVQGVRHGKWELIDECANEGVYCSNCHKKVYRTKYANQKIKSNYCPNCGAKMDKE